MFKYLTFVLIIAVSASISSCGGSEKKDKSGTEESKSDAPKTDAPKADVPKLEINEADWVDTDLSKTAPLIHVTVKLPKDAKIEKNGNGGADIHVNSWYTITVFNYADNLKSGLAGEKSMNKDATHKNLKYVLDEPNGYIVQYSFDNSPIQNHFVYMAQQNPEAELFKFASENNDLNTPPDAFSEDLARKVYNIIKTSVKYNK